MLRRIGSTGRWGWGAALAAAGLLAACGGGGGDPAAQGTLRMALTDAPSCYEHVYVTVEKVRVHRNADASGEGTVGWSEITVSPAKRIDLLGLTNGILEELGSTQLPAGTYSQVRLVLAANTGSNPLANAVQPVGGALVPLKTPSAQQSGLKLQAHFTVEENQTTDLVADFDACKSVVTAGNSGGYLLKPVVSVSPRVATGIQGYVSTSLTLGSTTVTAQKDGTVLRSTVPDAGGKFILAFLPTGTYTVVITSEGRATNVVTGVPVGATAGQPVTTLASPGSPILPPASTMRTVSGSVLAGTAALVDTTVVARQAVAGTTVEIASRQVDGELATYSLRLPEGAPLRAPYATGALTFTADAAAAGKYALEAQPVGRTPKQAAVDVTGADATANFTY